MTAAPRWSPVKPLFWRPKEGGASRPFCAGSGLVRGKRGFWALADDLNHLIRVPDGKGHAVGHRLFPGEPHPDPVLRKRLKRDLEALLDLGDGVLVAFPSGSRPWRHRGAVITLDARGRFAASRETDFRPLIRLLSSKIPDLNIEGGFARGGSLVLLQRGNGRAGFNGLATLSLDGFMRGLEGRWSASLLQLKLERRPLGKWGKVPLSFTDGFLREGTAYFCAAAEDGKDTYEDGKVLGSVVGALRDGKPPLILARLPGRKVEGICPGRARGRRLEIFAVTDDDDQSCPSTLLRLQIRPVRVS